MKLFVVTLLLAASSGLTGAAFPECRLDLSGLPTDGGGCAGVRVCIEGPADACRLRGPVRVGLGARKPVRLHPAPGSRCVTALQAEAGSEMTVRARARAGRRRGQRLRVRSAVRCPTSVPTDRDGSCSGLTIPVPVVGRRAHFPPSIPTEGACASASDGGSNYTNPAALIPPGQPSELHVIGVYEPDCRQPAPTWPFACLVAPEPVTVVVEPRPKPVVLALIGSEPVVWRIEVRPGASVERVLTAGYDEQTVIGVPAGVVQSLALEHYAYGWEIEHNSGGGGYWWMMSALREATGAVETSFQGCYTGGRFTIPYAVDPPTTCAASPVTGDEDIPQAAVVFPDCPDAAVESAACLTIVDGGLAVVGVDSGTVCPLGARQDPVSPDPSGASVGWLGEVLYQCTYGEGLVRIDLRTGARERLEMPCEAVTDDDGTLLVAPGFQGGITDFGAVYRVNGYRGLVSGEATRLAVQTWNSRFTTHGGLLYSAWHSTDTIDVHDVATGEAVRQVALAGYDGWIFGLDVTDDGRLFVAGMDDDGTLLMIFDSWSGARLGEHRLGRYWGASGLACRARGGLPPPSPPSTSPSTVTTSTSTTTSTTLLGQTSGGCVRTGCGGQLCDDHGEGTTCEWLPRYACYLSADCERQEGGRCGWTVTPELTACLLAGGPS